MPTEITLLGTGTSFGVPVIGCYCNVCTSDKPENKRTRTSVLLRRDDFNMLIDCSPDFRQQARTHRIDRLEAIIFTHHHADHVNGIDDLRVYWWHMRRPVELFGEPYVLADLRERFNYCFREQICEGAAPVLAVNEIAPGQPFVVGPFHIMPIRARHWNLDILGYRIGDFAYMTDCSAIPPESMKLLRGVKHLVINALRWTPHSAHFSLDQAVDVAKSLNVQHAYFTHISHKMEHFEAQEKLQSGYFMAFDGQKILIP